MDLLWLLCAASCVAALCSAERHSVYWNSTNPNFMWDDYGVEVRLNDYLDIVCPHYVRGEVPQQEAERYVLYMVEREDYDVCKPRSFDQLRWECSRPFAAHAPERFSEKFQRFTPFTLGKEFRAGETYYYISKPLHHHGQECMRLKVEVVGHKGSSSSSGKARGGDSKRKEAEAAAEKEKAAKDEGRDEFAAAGGVHNLSNRLPADDPLVLEAAEATVQRSVGSSGVKLTYQLSVLSSLTAVLLALLLH